eukprot:TRINITY_DN1177_c0_g3_i1.p1 TRINITY_DN1177_c0_g3~~TRINITY_DN1177_c0_g3_i1.p1  ORF type:complete len:1170 (+),score=252.71 TRINITY_DN1177_c0_g3_i1:129-3638(+)
MEQLIQRLYPQVKIEDIINSGASFTDFTFPHTVPSLVHSSQMAKYGEYATYSWKRSNDIFKGRRFDVFEGIDINDIEQGDLGDCYFLCSISAVAEFPNRIMELFVTREANKAGCYAVTGFVMGQRHTVVVDDAFPFDNKARKLAFAKPRGNEIWVLLLEKAWAKINGSFSNIVAGLSREGLHFLTGAPCDVIIHKQVKDKEEIWRRVKLSDEKNYIMTTSASGPISSEDYERAGLIKDHGYSLIDAKEFDYKGSKIRLVKLRNPWGDTEWNGAWSDKWSGWTPDLKRKAELIDKNDGTFYMAFDDFMKYYAATTICKYQDFFTHSTVIVENKEAACHIFEITAEGEGFIELCKYPKRLLRTIIAGYEEPFLGFILGKIEGNNLRFVTAISSLTGNVSVYFTPGFYVLFSTAKHYVSVPQAYGLHAYTSQEVNFVEHDWGHEAFGDLWKDYCRNLRNEWKDSKGRVIFFRKLEFDLGFGVIYMRNMTSDSECNETVNVELKGMEMLYPSRSTQVKARLAPNDELVIVAKIAVNDQINMSATTKEDFSKAKQMGRPVVHEETRRFIEGAIAKLKRSTIVSPMLRPSSTADSSSSLPIPIVKLPSVNPPAEPKPIPTQPPRPNYPSQPSAASQYPAYQPAYPAQPSYPTRPQSTYVPQPGYRPSYGAPQSYPVYPPQLYPSYPQGSAYPQQYPNYSPGYNQPGGYAPYPSYQLPVPAYQPSYPIYNPVQPQTNYNPQPVPAFNLKTTTTCPLGHTLSFAYYQYPGYFYNCNGCNTPKDYSQGRWFCTACNYSVCTVCKPMTVDEGKLTQMCYHGHELAFTKDVYTFTNYNCNRCRNTGVCVVGRWCCRSCQYNICNSCRTPPETSGGNEPRCRFGHVLKYIFTSFYSPYFSCSVCSRNENCCTGRWFCDTCYSDTCNFCLPPPKLQCPNSHSLSYANVVPNTASYVCPFCQKVWMYAQGSLYCAACKFSMCPNCVPMLLSSSGAVAVKTASDVDSVTFCNASHALFYSFSCASGPTYLCKKCGKSGSSAAGRWLCFYCDHNLCENCWPRPIILPKNTGEDYMCNARHELVFSANSGRGATYNCMKCGKMRSCAGGGFWCRKCRTAKCMQCAPVAFIPGSIKFCTQGHPLVLSTPEREEKNEYFRCNSCGRGVVKATPYYRCPICNYNICSNC